MVAGKKTGSNAAAKLDGKLNTKTSKKAVTSAKSAVVTGKAAARSPAKSPVKTGAKQPVKAAVASARKSPSVSAPKTVPTVAKGKAARAAAKSAVPVKAVKAERELVGLPRPGKDEVKAVSREPIKAQAGKPAAKPELKLVPKPEIEVVKGKPGRPPGKKAVAEVATPMLAAPAAKAEPEAAGLSKPKGKPGRPPKNAKAGEAGSAKPGSAKGVGKVAKPALAEADGDELVVEDQAEGFEDSDADAESIPDEVEVVVVPVKTKRGNRAKEKALLKEFGGRPGLTEADREATRNKLKQLIKLGKERGFLTYAEINDHLPEDVIDAEAIESIITTFNDMGIAVYDQAPGCRNVVDERQHADRHQ